MTLPKAHGAKCVLPHLIDMDELARVIAQAYGLTDPVEFDYETAQKVYDYIVTCSKYGQVLYLAKTGATKREIENQLGLSHHTITKVFEENGLV